jgi:hypothetical protein
VDYSDSSGAGYACENCYLCSIRQCAWLSKLAD